MSELAQDRADKMIIARNRHFQDLIDKKNYYAQKKLTEESNREKFAKRREKHKELMFNVRLGAIEGNQRSKEEIRHDNFRDKEA